MWALISTSQGFTIISKGNDCLSHPSGSSTSSESFTSLTFQSEWSQEGLGKAVEFGVCSWETRAQQGEVQAYLTRFWSEFIQYKK